MSGTVTEGPAREEGKPRPQRIGIHFSEHEPFYWDADKEETCPGCDPLDEPVDHRFYVAEPVDLLKQQGEARGERLILWHRVSHNDYTTVEPQPGDDTIYERVEVEVVEAPAGFLSHGIDGEMDPQVAREEAERDGESLPDHPQGARCPTCRSIDPAHRRDVAPVPTTSKQPCDDPFHTDTDREDEDG